MGEWQTYRLEDFIPFTAEVYFRLTERVNEAFWPLHLLTVALGAAALVFALRGRPRITLILLAPAWLSSGIIFHFNYYAEINVLARYFGWAFLAQAVLLLAIAAFARPDRTHNRTAGTSTWIGTAVAIAALLAYPLIAILTGAGPTRAETYGLHPDPTAITTLGIVLIALHGKSAWATLAIPFAWCAITTATLIPLQAAWAILPLLAGIVVTATTAARSIASTPRR